MRNLLLLTFVSLIIFNSAVFSQDNSKNTLTLTDGMLLPEATLEEISWISGHWKGEGMGGTFEEIWTEPDAGSMMGSFRHMSDDQVNFYELMTITKENNSLLLRIKHFNPDLAGWEEKEESVEFKLLKLTETHAYFDGLTFEKVSDTSMNVFVITEEGDNQSEIKFSYFKN